MPYDVAFTLPDVDVAAYTIIFSEFENNKFDWSSMTWQKSER